MLAVICLATNLNYLYSQAHEGNFSLQKVIGRRSTC